MVLRPVSELGLQDRGRQLGERVKQGLRPPSLQEGFGSDAFREASPRLVRRSSTLAFFVAVQSPPSGDQQQATYQVLARNTDPQGQSPPHRVSDQIHRTLRDAGNLVGQTHDFLLEIDVRSY